MAKIIKDDLQYLLFSEIYDRYSEPKAKRRAFGILEAAISVLYRKGFDGITLEMVAREAGVTRPLIKHYFNGLDDLNEIALRYVRLLFQKLAVEAIKKEGREDRMLAAYIRTCFEWAGMKRTHALVWLAFLQRCGKREEERKLNTVSVNAGEARIQALLERGRHEQVFAFEDPVATMKLIQTLITGGLLTVLSEDLADRNAYAELIGRQCLRVAGAK